MINLDIIFTILHYAIYSAIGVWAYRKYLLPYFLQERQNELMQTTLLEAARSQVGHKKRHLEHQIDYFTGVFKKISQQNKQAQAAQQLHAAQVQEQARLGAEQYRALQDKQNYARLLQRASLELEPIVIQQLQAELKTKAQQQGPELMRKALARMRADATKRGQL